MCRAASSDQYVLTGIVSSSDSVDYDVPGAYTKVSYFRDWIADITGCWENYNLIKSFLSDILNNFINIFIEFRTFYLFCER